MSDSGEPMINTSNDASESSLSEGIDGKALYAAILAFDLKKVQSILEALELRKSLNIVYLFDEQG